MKCDQVGQVGHGISTALLLKDQNMTILTIAHLELELLSRGNEEEDSGTMEHRQELTCLSL